MEHCRSGIWRRWYGIIVAAGILLLGLFATAARADGTETLGAPSVTIADGSDVIVAGVGLSLTQPGDIDFDVPAGATVEQVLIYWEGRYFGASGDDDITVNGMPVTGQLIGGPITWTVGGKSEVYRADITGLGLVGEGANVLTIGDLAFDNVNNGAGVFVIIDDGSQSSIELRDGNDMAFFAWEPPQDTTVAQTFTFAASNVDREGTISMMASAVAGQASSGGPLRPSVIEVRVDDVLTGEFNNLLDSVDGEEWDSHTLTVDIPAGATEVTVQVLSEDRLNTGANPASFAWIGGGLTISVPPSPEIEICTLVTLNADMVSDFSDADGISGDGCDVFPQSIPMGVVSMVDGTYRLKVTNTGPETLVNVRINAPDFGLVNQPIPTACGDLDPGEMCIINFGDPGFPTLKMLKVCEAPGQVTKIASVDGEGQNSGIPVSDDDPASVDCTAEPDITLRKEVSLDGGPFLDANTPAAGPSGSIGADAEYRLIVENTGTETVINAVINDATLGLTNVPVPGGPLAPTDIRTITQGSIGFGPLLFIDRCDTVGEKLNIAKVDAAGETSGTPVASEDPAYVNCEDPMIRLLKQISLDGVNFFDADMPGDADVPVGIVGFTDATYRFIVENIGTEPLTNVLIEDATLNITTLIADLAVGEVRVIESGDTGFGNLFQTMRCGGEPGNKSNIAKVTAAGANTGTPVSDDDPANVRCIVGPEIVLLKQVSLDGVNFFDADTAADGPVGAIGADATYRLIVRNVGDEGLTNVLINDTTLGIVDAAVPDLPIGGEVILDTGDIARLFFEFRCDSVGAKLNIADVNANGMITGTPVTDNDPAYVNCEAPPSCDLQLDKQCSIAPETSNNLLCESAIAATTLRYIGPDLSNATVTFEGTKNGLAQYTGVDLVSGVTVLTMAGQNGFTIDSGGGLGSKTNITINGELEIIHTSCSAIYAAGQPAPLDGGTPNPPNSDKGDPSPNWFVVNFRDKDGAFVTTPPDDGGEFTNSCSFTQEPLPSCDNGPKPDTLTWRYDGGTGGDGDCGDSTFFTIMNDDGKLHSDFECTGSVNTAQSITAVDDDGNVFVVGPGESFTTAIGDSKTISISNSGGTQDFVFHTSCSQPLEAGATAGALTLAALDDRDGARDVTYRYEVTNLGDALTNVLVIDDKLGDVGSIALLGTNATETFTKSTQLFATTTNRADASGMLNGDVCMSDPDFVTVRAVAPTCLVSIVLDKIEDKKIKWKLSNLSNADATIDNLTISWPGNEKLKKVKFDGSDILKDVALSSPANITSGDWQKELKDRILEGGDSGKKLEFEFTGNFPQKKEQPAGDFDLNVNFEEGCSVEF